MSNKSSAIDLLDAVKTIVNNYLSNRKLTAMVVGTYNGASIMINERLPIPMDMVKGGLTEKLSVGDRVRLLRNDGGKEYYILEIIDRRCALIEEVEESSCQC